MNGLYEKTTRPKPARSWLRVLAWVLLVPVTMVTALAAGVFPYEAWAHPERWACSALTLAALAAIYPGGFLLLWKLGGRLVPWLLLLWSVLNFGAWFAFLYFDTGECLKPPTVDMLVTSPI